MDGMYLWRYARDLHERVCVPKQILWGMNYKAWSLYWTSSGTSDQIWRVWNAGRSPPIQTLFLLSSRWLMDLMPFTSMQDVRFSGNQRCWKAAEWDQSRLHKAATGPFSQLRWWRWHPCFSLQSWGWIRRVCCCRGDAFTIHTLPGYRKKSSAHCQTHHRRMIIFRWQYCATWGLNQVDWNVLVSRLLVTYSGE